MSKVTRLKPRMEFAVLFAPPEFVANGRPAGGMPLLLDETGALHEGATTYFIQRMGWEGATAGTMRMHAYALKDWLENLADRRVDWRDASDALLSDWAAKQGASSVGEVRINTKLACVFAFYRTLQEIGELRNVVEDPLHPASDEDGRPRRFPISAVVKTATTGRAGVQRVSVQPRVHYRDPAKVTGRRRYTPDGQEVEAILDQLLTGSAQDEYARVRNYLCAKVMSQTGLRREGTAALTTTAIQKALEAAGIPAGELRPSSSAERHSLIAAGWRPWARGLDAIACMPDRQSRIIDALGKAEVRHERNIHVTVVEKGRKERVVPVPLKLVRALLVEWVWDHRRRFIDERRQRHPSYLPPAELWLSRKTGRGMTDAAIANEVKRAFNEANVDASAHRLRAFFLSNLVDELYVSAKAAHGRMFDARTILDQAAEIAGHASPGTLKPYLTAAMKKETFRRGEVVHVDQASDAELLQQIAAALNDGDAATAETVRRMLGMLAERVGTSK